MKWAYVKIKNLNVRGRFQFLLVPITQGMTVVQFRALWREDPESVVFVPERTLRLFSIPRGSAIMATRCP